MQLIAVRPKRFLKEVILVSKTRGLLKIPLPSKGWPHLLARWKFITKICHKIVLIPLKVVVLNKKRRLKV